MKNKYKVAVIGGGASGLFACIELFNNGLSYKDVVLFERLDRVGKKLLSTGNGQCNITNNNISEKNYFGDETFISNFIKQLSIIDIKKYLYNIGIPLTSDADGKVYPLSKQANCVLDTIRYSLSEKVDFVFNSKVTNIIKRDNLFEIIENNQKYFAENVILAVGGKCAKQFGTDGTSYNLAETFGHKTTKLYPALVQIKTDTQNIKMFNGIREQVCLSVLQNKKCIYKTTGDVIFTNYGVSGNAVFKASSYIVDRENINLSLDFLPTLTIGESEKLISDRLKNGINIPKEDILSTIVNKKIGQQIIKMSKDLSPKTLANQLKNFQLTVIGNMGYDYAQVTRGGIKTCDIDFNSYESKLCNNLYIVGEMLDVDGECGGYNLTFAIVSAIICAKNIKNKLV